MNALEGPDGEFKDIGHIVDHFSKFHILYPLKTKKLWKLVIMDLYL